MKAGFYIYRPFLSFLALESESKTREKLDYLNKACGCFEGVLGLTFQKTKGKSKHYRNDPKFLNR